MARILVADDDQSVALMLKVALSQSGHHVVIASNGEKALERLKQDPSLQIILLDLMMPVYDGRTVIERIRANPKTRLLTVILITGSEYDPNLFPPEDSYQALVKKPFDILKLVNLLDQFIGNGKSEMTAVV